LTGRLDNDGFFSFVLNRQLVRQRRADRIGYQVRGHLSGACVQLTGCLELAVLAPRNPEAFDLGLGSGAA